MRESDVSNGDTMECRPKAKIFWGGAVGLAIVMLIIIAIAFDSTKDSKPVMIVFVVLGFLELLAFAAVAIGMIIHALRFRVIADANGLRWRGAFHGWRSTAWSEVTDYYLEMRRLSVTDNRTMILPTIVTKYGVIKVGAEMVGDDKLKQFVRERATAARVSEWEQLGVRRVDSWPQTFRYWNAGTPFQFATQMAAYAVFLSIAGWGLYRLHSWYAGLSTAVETQRITPALLFAFLILFSLPAMVAYRYRTLWKRRKEQFTVTPEALLYTSRAGETLEMTWSEIGDYFYHSRNTWAGGIFTLVLRGADEKQISWTRWLPEASRLLAVVQQYAPQPAFMKNNARLWREKNANESKGGSDPTTWQGGAVGIGGRVFTLKNTNNIALLSGSCLFGIFFITVFMLAIGQMTTEKDYASLPFMLGMTLFVIGAIVYSLVCFFRIRVESDDMGITQHTLFGKKYLPWYAIADYRELRWARSSRGMGNGFIQLTGKNGTRITIWDTINGFGELKDEIEQLAPLPKTG